MSNQQTNDDLQKYLDDLNEVQSHNSVPGYWLSKNQLPPLYKGLSSGNKPRWVQVTLIFMGIFTVIGMMIPLIAKLLK